LLDHIERIMPWGCVDFCQRHLHPPIANRIAEAAHETQPDAFAERLRFAAGLRTLGWIDPTKTNHLTIRLYPLGFRVPKRELDRQAIDCDLRNPCNEPGRHVHNKGCGRLTQGASMIPKKPAPDLIRVGTGFPPSRSPLRRAKEGRKRSCSNKNLEPGSDPIKPGL